ncbi:hypothetical protein GUJ93_ZPchr0008g13439 [Zizania palustris]|uniref:Uncharacterized protein n=1 Tax=Zizania palustris TaxID=103762 RepID=A0A8J5VKC6_ZIZPA|nr:hypothetical protein GUJ93_ZPchr0008g13439 [Zizania palustris]
MEDMVLCVANHVPLTLICFLERIALVYPDCPAIVTSGTGGMAHTSASSGTTWSQRSLRTFQRCASCTSSSRWPAPPSTLISTSP